MKRFLSILLMSSCLWGLTGVTLSALQASTSAQTTATQDLYYLYQGKRIPLTVRQDAIAVAFKPEAGGARGTTEPAYLQLQHALQPSTRGDIWNIEVHPLGSHYAVVKFPATRGGTVGIEQQAQQQAYVASTLPVLTRSGQNDAIVLPNEIIVSFQAGLSQSQQQALLDHNQLEIIRPLRFTQNRYLVRSRAATGTALLEVSNQLNQTAGVKSATPNFMQALAPTLRGEGLHHPSLDTTSPASSGLKSLAVEQPNSTPFQTDLLPLQWYLNSTAMLQQLAGKRSQPPKTRPDIHATEAWQHSQAGKGVVVAVLDNLIQWDHPDLVRNLYTVGNQKDKLPGEVHGWDFSSDGKGDPDTRISQPELDLLQPAFQDSFKLSDTELKQKYALSFAQFQQASPKASLHEIAQAMREQIRYEVVDEFHGTMTAGMITAHAQDRHGLIGVAPKATLLPVRVGKLGAGISATAIIEAVGYAASRGADVISMSFGSLLPNTEEAAAIAEVLKVHPNLVIVASSGNETSNQIAFPAAVKGVVAVGATNLAGQRADYSNFGPGLDVVAPGGDTSEQAQGGILTTCGTEVSSFWSGITSPTAAWQPAQDPKGAYVWIQGTSFSAPAVAGVFALMKGEDPQRQLTRERLITLLKTNASYSSLTLSQAEVELYRSFKEQSKLSPNGSMQQFFFGSGLVNADAAVQAVKDVLDHKIKNS